MKGLIISFVMAIGIIVMLFASSPEVTSNKMFIPAMLGMPIFIIIMLFAVFGKDLFKKSTNTSSQEEVEKNG